MQSSSLMCHGTLDIDEFEARHWLDFRAYFADELVRLRELAHDGLIAVEPQRLVVTSRGRFLLRIIAMCFDAHLPREGATTQMRYSRAL